MRNFNWSAILGSLLTIFFPTQTPPQPPVNSPAVNSDLTWTTLLSQAAPPTGTPPGGSRGSGDEIVPLIPGAISAETWSNSPLFLWQGVSRQIELLAATGRILWSQRFAETDRYCFYAGAPLPSGSYEWMLYSPAKVAVSRVAFRVMQPQDQSRIASDLAALVAQLPAATPEQVALQKANYFAERQLWSDVFREAFSVTNPSPELSALLETIPNLLIG
jgi:hypothetical protein